MRPVLCGLAAGLMAWQAAAAYAQQGSLQLSAAAQGLAGASRSVSGENAVDPDFGVSWLQPGVRFGSFQIEIRGTRRTDRLHVGRTYAALRDYKLGGLAWTLEAGDTYITRAIGEYRFSNLTTPAVTFSGGTVSGRHARGRVDISAGRATAWRNIFGSDPDTLGQTIALARGSFRATDRLEVVGRASRLRTSGLKEFSFSIADSRQAASGVRFALTPDVQLIADGAMVSYRRVDSPVLRHDGSFLAGAHVQLARGWVQINASRFSPGEFPAMNDSLHDRAMAFAAAEYDVLPRIRLFGGWERTRTNLAPDPTGPPEAALPHNLGARGFGGIRFQVSGRSTVTLRVEDGARIARPVLGGLDRESDTGLRALEWQTAFRSVTSYARVSRRENVDRTSADTSYTLNDVSGQVFVRMSQSTQIFGLATVTRHELGAGGGSSYWQAGGGAQVQLPNRNLWVRGEATASRDADILTRDFVPRESFNVGVNGQLARTTSFAFNIAADHTPLLLRAGTPWTTRSTVRIVQTFSTGAARVPGTLAGAGTAARARGTGTIVGNVFTDWNSNGMQDPDEEAIENIPVRVRAISAVTTRRDGEFSFVNVPAGSQQVGLDTSAVPVDFDPPAESSVTIELDRSTTRRVSFGLIPLGSLHGRVVRDANANGAADQGEESVDGAVLVLDGGARSERVQRGAYRFDGIRAGNHVVTLLTESLPEGAAITGAREVRFALGRGELSREIDFVVSIERRPEMRRVFPPRIGSAAPGGTPPGRAAAVPARAAATQPARPPASRPVVSPPAPGNTPAPAAPSGRVQPAPVRPDSTAAHSTYAVQVAALLDPVRAQALVQELTRKGYPVYLIEPPAGDPDGPYRVRLGAYPSRAAAMRAAAQLERARNEKLWVIRQ
jgi:cell division septation protein DedD